jgi:hypothetical protein
VTKHCQESILGVIGRLGRRLLLTHFRKGVPQLRV